MGVVSIKNLTLALSVGLICISGGLTGYMSISTGEDALSSTEKTYENGLAETRRASAEGLDSCFAAGIANSESLATQLMGKVVDEIAAKLDGYLATPKSVVETVSHWILNQPPCYGPNGEILDCNWKEHEWIENVASPFLFSVYRNARELGVTETFALSFPQYNQTIQYYVENPLTSQTAEEKIALGIDPDYHETYKAEYPRTLCNIHFNRQQCNIPESQLPDWMTLENWRQSGTANPGCLWCERDTASTANLPLAANPDHYARPGYCSWNNWCDFGFKKVAGYSSKDWNSLSIANQRGQARMGPCTGMLESARIRGAKPLTCPVPGVLSVMDLTLAKAMTATRHLDARRMLWSPLTGRGPQVSLQVYRGATADHMWDFGDVFGKLQMLSTASLDVRSTSTFMQKIVAPLQTGTVLYGVQQSPFYIEEPPISFVCEDDPFGVAKVAGIPCSVLVPLLGCDTDLHSVSDIVARFMWIRDVCPLSCNACPKDQGHGLLLGASRGKAFAEFPLNRSSFADLGLIDRFPIHVVDCEDPVIRSHGKYMMSLNTSRGFAYRALDTSALHSWWYDPADTAATIRLPGDLGTKNVSADTGERRQYWVRILPVTDEETALRLHVVLLILREEAMRTINEATETTRAQAEMEAQKVKDKIAVESKDTDDEKQKNFNIMIIIVVVACVVLMVLSVFFVLSIIRPLLQLEFEMAEVACMHLERIDVERAPHSLEEVGNMQKSFYIMVNNLIEYRNYMPKSILVEDDEEEDEVMDDDNQSSKGGSNTVRSSQSPNASKSDMSQALPRHRSSMMSSKMAGTEKSQSVLLRDQAPHKPAGLGEGLKKKSISVCVLNIQNWHQHMEGASDMGAGSFSAVLLMMLEAVTAPSKGVPETFNGDRLTVSWNAVKACNVHKPKCIDTAYAIQTKLHSKEVEQGKKGIHVSVACVTGDARVGNIGCPGMKKFSLMSPVVTWLYALERAGRRLSEVFVVDRWMFQETKNNYLYRAAEYAQYTKRNPKPMLIYSLTGAKSASEDEWMYQLEEGEKNDPNSSWNGFVEAAIAQNWAAALESAEAAKQCSGISQATLERFSGAVTQQVELQPFEVCFH